MKFATCVYDPTAMGEPKMGEIQNINSYLFTHDGTKLEKYTFITKMSDGKVSEPVTSAWHFMMECACSEDRVVTVSPYLEYGLPPTKDFYSYKQGVEVNVLNQGSFQRVRLLSEIQHVKAPEQYDYGMAQLGVELWFGTVAHIKSRSGNGYFTFLALARTHSFASMYNREPSLALRLYKSGNGLSWSYTEVTFPVPAEVGESALHSSRTDIIGRRRPLKLIGNSNFLIAYSGEYSFISRDSGATWQTFELHVDTTSDIQWYKLADGTEVLAQIMLTNKGCAGFAMLDWNGNEVTEKIGGKSAIQWHLGIDRLDAGYVVTKGVYPSDLVDAGEFWDSI